MTMHTQPPRGPQSPAGGHFVLLPSHVTPQAFRAALADEIERMIDLLDALDGDPDIEPDLAGFPNLGAPCDAEDDAADSEPSLGSCDRMLNQENWSRYAGGYAIGDDLELDRCDDEDGHDREASDLAGCSAGNLEADDDTGIGDQDGLEEQVGRFDRSGDEAEAADRYVGYEERLANRQLRAVVDRQARTLAHRLRPPAFAGNLRVLDPWEIVR